MLAYYLADRANGVRVAMFNPGVTNTDWTQAGMAADLASNGTPLLLLNDALATVSEPFNDSSILGSTVLDTFIAEHYQLVCDFGSIRILALPDRAARVRCAIVQEDERLLDILGRLVPVPVR
jgi:hypothetical protein